jgi:DNA-binding SARP family transcriptional activator/DNA-binding transcriptional ArsR family regulator
MATLRIYFFGGFRVYYGDENLPPFPTRKTRSLFAYLVTYRQRSHPRPVLAGIFWPDMPDVKAHRNLNTTLWRLRRSLPSGYILVEEETIGFNTASDYWLDVALFERMTNEAMTKSQMRKDIGHWDLVIGHLRNAVELYRGDFLEGFYEDWCLVEAERLRGLYLQALHGLLAYHKAGGEYQAALEYGQRLLAADPLREDVHRQVMELYELLGQRSAALAQFEACRRVLREELGVEPLPETVALYEGIRSASLILASPSAPPPASLLSPAQPLPRTPFDDFGQVALVGRQKELAWLMAHVEETRQGHGGMVLVMGEAGVGKTRLVQEMVCQATGQGAWVLQGVCHELSEPPPYQGLVDALRSAFPQFGTEELARISPVWLSEMTFFLPELGQIVPGLPPRASLPPPEQRGRLLEALAQFLTGMSRATPCIIVIEDLQWADSATLDALRYLLPHLAATRVLLISTVRSEELEVQDELRQTICSLEETGLLHRLHLERLSQAETGRLVEQVLGPTRKAPNLIEQIYRETEGNPFFVAELLKALFEEGLLHRDEQGEWSTPWDESAHDDAELPLPRGICQAVQRRLMKLSGKACQVLDLASVLGREFDFDLLWCASGWDEETVLEATDDLLRRQLLAEEGERLRFTHDKIRQVAYQGLSRARRRRLHRQAGQALEALAPDRVEELANHFYLGGEPRRALGYCLQAGDHARTVYASRAALTYYGWVIEAAQQVGDAAARETLVAAHEGRGQVWEHLGQYPEALADYEAMQAAAEGADDLSGAARAVRRCGWIRGSHQGDWSLGLEEARRAHQLALRANDRHEAAAALRDIGTYYNMQGDYVASLEAHRAALASFRDLGDAAGQATSLHYIAVTHLFLSQHTEALDAFRQALAIWERVGNPRAVAKIWCNIGQVHINQGEFTAAEEALRRAERGFRAIEAAPALPLVLIGLAALHRYRGRCRECLEVLREALAIEEKFGASPYNRALILLHRGWARWAMGELGAGLADLQEALALARQTDTPTLVVTLLNALGRCHRRLGDPEQALVWHQESLTLARKVAFGGGEAEALTELGLDHLALGQVATALTHLEAAWGVAHELGAHSQIESLLGLGRARLASGHPAQAHTLATQALELTRTTDVRELQIRGHELAGWALAALNQQAAAESALWEALALTDPPGYALLRGRVMAALADVRDRQGHPAEASRLRTQAQAIVQQAARTLDDEVLRAALLSLFEKGAPHIGCTTPLQTGQIRLRLARIGAPRGRPLREDERVTVVWTVDAGPEDEALRQCEGKVALRRARILRLLAEATAQGADPTEADLARALGVTVRTIRSDVAALRRAGYPIRTRGSRISS